MNVEKMGQIVWEEEMTRLADKIDEKEAKIELKGKIVGSSESGPKMSADLQVTAQA